jgi:glycosyltransferase involved in cell wall biosynthesis
MKKKILVNGPALTRSGYGEMARFALRALKSREDIFDIYLNSTGWGSCGWIHDNDDERNWIDEIHLKTSNHTQSGGQYDISLQISIPNEFKPLAPINIGYTAGIETTKISPHWIQPSEQMNKIIVLSEFGKKGFDNGVYEAMNQATGQKVQNYRVTKPVVPVGFPVRKHVPANLELNLETDFNFLCIAQAGPRKNLGNTIAWFMQEFKNDSNVGLICKTHLAGASQIDRDNVANQLSVIINNHKDSKCKVYLLHGDMTDQEMAALYVHPKVKALVSFSHGEGFGLPIFEATYYGLPVITTDWSSQTDFLYCLNKEGKTKPHFVRVDFTVQPVQPEAVWAGVIEKDSMWAFPIGNSAKSEMRTVYKDWDRYRGQAKRLMEHNIKSFTNEALYSKFVEALGININQNNIDVVEL